MRKYKSSFKMLLDEREVMRKRRLQVNGFVSEKVCDFSCEGLTLRTKSGTFIGDEFGISKKEWAASGCHYMINGGYAF